MKLTNLIKSIILEATPEEIYKKYYEDIPYNTFKNIISADPSTKITGDKIERIGPYSKMLLGIHKNGNLKTEDLPKATEYLTIIYNHKIPVDVSKIRYISDIYPLVEKYIIKKTIDLSLIIGSLSPNEYTQVFDGKDWVILIPKTEKAACYLGVNTQWCTTWGPLSLNPDFRDRTNRFKQYNKTGLLYIIIKKSNINEKYQFHFPEKQYMNVNDNPINAKSFLSENPEIKYFFFPSLVNESLSFEKMTEELDKLDILPQDDIKKITERISSNTNNILIKAVVSNDVDKINELIIFPLSTEYVEDVENGKVIFKMKLMGDLDSVYNTLKGYKSERYNSYDYVYDDVSNNDNYYFDDIFISFLKKYYEQNKTKIFREMGLDNYEIFEESFLEKFYEDIMDKYINKYAELNQPNFEASMAVAEKEIENYFEFGYASYNSLMEVKVNLGYFVKYLTEQNIDRINDINDFFENFIYHYSIPTEFDSDVFYNWERSDVNYDNLKDDIEDVIEEYYNDDSLDCVKLRNDLHKIKLKFMNGTNKFENDEFELVILENSVDCEEKSIFVNYLSKKTNEKFDGTIKIENLPQYFITHKLFETIMSFKRFI
jgi:hypothetical protein